ncbi:hypothetical protein FGIG_12435 [Fasciola gigantica]|uniref:Uncharacterized protein n=1 Tax=Fasciola gigantica TaxID=46835 RepID=A0A504YJS2_FASGI|nr:hypothetical protein FGIG_12435 [Fasciola gigantica]
MKDNTFSSGATGRNQALAEYERCQPESKYVENWIQSTATNQPDRLDQSVMNTRDMIQTECDSCTNVHSADHYTPSIVYNDQLYETDQSPGDERSWTSDYSRSVRSYSVALLVCVLKQ